jgi:hypothetical protein
VRSLRNLRRTHGCESARYGRACGMSCPCKSPDAFRCAQLSDSTVRECGCPCHGDGDEKEPAEDSERKEFEA